MVTVEKERRRCERVRHLRCRKILKVRCEPQAAHGHAALACGYLPSTATPLLAARNAGFQHAPDTPSNPPCDHAAAYKPALHAVPPNCPNCLTRPTRPHLRLRAKFLNYYQLFLPTDYQQITPPAPLLTHVKTSWRTNLLTIELLFPLTLQRENYFT